MSHNEPPIDVESLALAAHITAVDVHVTYERDPNAATPTHASRAGWQHPVRRIVTVAFTARLPDAATAPAAAADLLYMRAPAPDGTAPAQLRPASWQARWSYRRPADAAPRLALHARIDGPEFGYAIDFAPLTRWGLALERAERERRLRVELVWAPPDRALPITVTLAFDADDMPIDGLREFARDWRREALDADQLSIPKPPDLPA